MDNINNGVESPIVVNRSEKLSLRNQSYQRKSGLSLHWEDFFGSNSDLSSSVEQGWQTLTSTDIDLDIDQLDTSHNSDARIDSSQKHLVSSVNIPASRYNKTNSTLPLSSSSGSLIARRSNKDDSVTSKQVVRLSGWATVPGYVAASDTKTSLDQSHQEEYESQDNFSSSGGAIKRPLSYVSSTSSSSSSLPRRPSERKKLAIGVPTDSCPEEISLDSDSEEQSGGMTKLEIERQMTLTAEPPNEEEVKKDRVVMVIEELIETENTYIKSLEEVKNGYIDPIKSGNICDDETRNAIFSNLPDLCSFHQCFLEELKSSELDIVRLSNWFINNAELFQSLYGDYCTNYTDAMQQLEETRRLNQRLWEFLLSCQQSLQHQLPLATYLLKPVQRILKYQLLLQELCKSLYKSEESNLVPTVKRALSYMANVADAINERKRATENAERVAKLRNLLKESSTDLDVDGLGDLVLDGEFRLPGKKDPRYVLLFQKAILMTKRLDSHVIAVKHVIRCTNLMLIETINKDPLAFHVMPFDNPKCQQTLLASNHNLKREWCHHIKQLILENYDAAIPEKAKLIVLNMAELMPNLSAQKPALQESEEAPMPKPPRKSNGAATLTRRHSEVTSPTNSGDFHPGNGVDMSFNGVEMRQRDSGSNNFSSSPRPGSKTLELNEFDKVWSELVAKHCHSDVLSVTTPGHDDNLPVNSTCSLSCSPGSVMLDMLPTATLFDDDDFRCIAVEINEERSGSTPFLNNNSSSNGTAPVPSSSQTVTKTKGHSRNNSKGSLKLTGGGNLATNLSSDHEFMTGSDSNQTTGSSRCNATSIYIDCSQENYDKVTFGRAYYHYIEKTRTQIELTANDIDEIFQPLKLAFTEEAKQVSTPPTASPHHQKVNQIDDSAADKKEDLEEDEEEGSSCGSSPRHIVSRIAVHKRKVSAPVAPNVIQISTVGRAEGRSFYKGSTSPPHHRPSLFSSNLTRQDSAGNTKKSSSNQNTLSDNSSKSWLPRPNSNNSLEGSTSSSFGKSNLVQRFFRAYNRNNKREKKVAEISTPSTNDEDAVSQEEVSVLSLSSSKEEIKQLAASSSKDSIKNTPPGRHHTSARPSDTASGQNVGTLSRKKHRAPPPPAKKEEISSCVTPNCQKPPSNGTNDESEAAASATDLEVCRGRVKNAMKTLIESDNIPYADDVAGSPPPANQMKLGGVTSESSTADSLSPRLKPARLSHKNELTKNVPTPAPSNVTPKLVPATAVSSGSPTPTWAQQNRTLKKAPAPSPPTNNLVQRSASLSQPLKPPRRFQNTFSPNSNDVSGDTPETAKVKRPVNLTSSSSFSSGKCGTENPTSRFSNRPLINKSKDDQLHEDEANAPVEETKVEALPPRGLVKSMMNKFQ